MVVEAAAATVVPTKAVMADRIEAEAAVDSVVAAEALTEAAEEDVVQEAAWGRCLTMGSVCVGGAWLHGDDCVGEEHSGCYCKQNLFPVFDF